MDFDWTVTHRPKTPKGAPCPMQQHRFYGEACRRMGSTPLWLDWRVGQQVLGSALVLRRKWPLFGKFALLSRGPCFALGVDPEEAALALRALVLQLADDHRGVMATPDLIGGQDPLAGAGLLCMVTGGHVARLSLVPSPATLRAGLHQKWRNRLCRAEAAGLTVEAGPMPPDPYHWLLREEARQARARRYARLPVDFTVGWAIAGETLLMTAQGENGPMAGALFLIHKPWASYHIGWTSDAGRAVHAHNLLIWEAALALRARGVTALDLGTLDTVQTPGLARFKLATGAEAVPLGATWMRAVGSGAVARLSGLRGLDPRHAA